ncbi:MAG: hypothetical protein A2269_05190 [Lentisphaerae bacterium RIFOXYA12_FULL_60_10]|nr:MAG: hypothetical protein A2269_05190 [Lentisphaerae bacterium RIFOXYA12_FULL_60_10]
MVRNSNKKEMHMTCRNGIRWMVLLTWMAAAGGFAQDNFLPGDKVEALIGAPAQTGIQIVKAGTSVILQGVCTNANTKFTIWRLQQKFSNISDLTRLSREAYADLTKMEQSFSEELALSFSQRVSEQIAADLRFKLVEGRLVVSGYANNKEDIEKITNIAKIFDKNPVINVEMRKDMIEIDAIFCRIQRTDGSSIGTKGLQSAKIEIPRLGYNVNGAPSPSVSDAVNNRNGTYSAINHRAGLNIGTQTELAGGAVANAITANFGVTEDNVKILVRPHLSTLNGQEAVFHSGGQQPFTIINQQAQNIEWKDFGTKLTILPTFTSDGLIEVDVYIELTIPLNDTANRFTKFSHHGRAILKENEALVLSGLIQQIFKMNIERTPFLSKIPIIGFFCGNKDKNHDQEEMVVVVMPRRPVTAKLEVTESMMGSAQMQNLVTDTAPDMGPIPDNKKNRRPGWKK